LSLKKATVAPKAAPGEAAPVINMKPKFYLAILLAIFTCIIQTIAQGTAFTYQGRLNVNGNPANGLYDLTFTLFDTNNGGASVVGPVTNNAVGVTNGLFTVLVDFGSSTFVSVANWLEIDVATNRSSSFNTLIPRQQLTPTPYAITAENLATVVQNNTIADTNFATISGGYGNYASFYSVVGGGNNNEASDTSAIGGGSRNSASGGDATVAGGQLNTAASFQATVGGGFGNDAYGASATVSGGYQNAADGDGATVPGGYNNYADGTDSFAAGTDAQALHDGTFVWADDNGGNFASTGANQFDVRASGGINLAGDVSIAGGANSYHHLSLNGGNSTGFLYGSYLGLGDGINLGYNFYYDNSGVGHVINTGGGSSLISARYGEIVLAVGGVNASPNGNEIDITTSATTVYGTFNNSSDRNAKQDFAPVSPAELLAKVAQLPISEWSYKTDAATRHIGPMGQDFYATFNIGTDEKHIAPIDEGGVALAAIQGLNLKLNEKDAEIKKLEQQLGELQAAVKLLAAQK
jgi:hypothetical protein